MIMPEDHHSRSRDAQGFGHRLPRQVGGLMVWRRQRQLEAFVDHNLIETNDPGGRVLSLSRPATSSAMKRFCQRLTQGSNFPSPPYRQTAKVLCRRQNDLGSPNMLLSRTASGDRRLKPPRVRNFNMDVGTRAFVSHPFARRCKSQKSDHPFRSIQERID